MYCRNCGNKLNDGDQICNNCNTPVNNNVSQNNPATVQKTGKNPFLQILKHELILIGIVVGWFVVITLIIVVINIINVGPADTYTLRHHPSAMYNLIMKGFMPFIQIIIPALVIMFGWIPILIYDIVKNS